MRVVVLRGVSETLADIDSLRRYEEGKGLIHECLAYASGAGFKDVFSEFGLEQHTAQEFRQRHILRALGAS